VILRRLGLAALLIAGTTELSAQSVLNRGNRYEPASLDPHKIQTHYESAVVLDLFEGLTSYDAAAQPRPGVAESWTVSADGKRWTFKLRPGVVWSDGKPLTSADVVFTFRRLMNPATAAQYAQLLYLIAGGAEVNTGAKPTEQLAVAAPDPQTVTIDLVNPAPYLPELLANAFASILPRQLIEASGDSWVRAGTMAGNGPFTLTEWQPQARIVLDKNPRFREAATVKLERVIYHPTADLTSALARFRAGELDMQFEFPNAQAEFLRQNLPAETRVGPSLLTYYLALNGDNPKLKDVRVRRALSLAIDRETLVGRVLKTGESAAYTLTAPGTANYALPDIADAKMADGDRVAEARRLLADAGYNTGNPLKIAYSHTANEDIRRTAVAIAAMWKRAGIQTEFLSREGKVHFASLKAGDFEAGYVGWSADFNDAASFLYILQSNSVNSNYARYRNATFDKLMFDAAAESDAAKRSALLREAEALAMSEQAIVPLFHGVTKNLVSKRVAGFTANPSDFYPSRYLSLH
jgi:oligopeptide transport system substrate-binding protein